MGTIPAQTMTAGQTATVTVTASDPDGLTATQSADVTVEHGGGFRDEFDTAASSLKKRR
ncbi:hypothetical protein [Candidatus Palauibacter sp.]|uniref:hypothetical protein n=1 Tax=Candidatus Palauibacter sp. TaxID=3101350 RepID=UPI003B02B039